MQILMTKVDSTTLKRIKIEIFGFNSKMVIKTYSTYFCYFIMLLTLSSIIFLLMKL